jgi:hypothetical protein
MFSNCVPTSSQAKDEVCARLNSESRNGIESLSEAEDAVRGV